jgi:hypothetical protein
VPISPPSLTLTITPPGGSPVNYTNNLAWAGADGQLQISQNFGRQGDTASLTLVDEFSGTPNFYIPVMSQIKLFDNTANVTLFAGVVNDPTQHVSSPNRNEWQLQCTDYTFYADNAIVHGTFVGQTVDQIVISLTAQANCGISAASTASGGFVRTGPQLANFVLNYTTLSQAWRTLAILAGSSTPYGWYVDENRALHFFDSSTALPSGVTFTTTPTTFGSTTEGHIALDGQNGWEIDGTSIHNRILVQGAYLTKYYGSTNNAPTDTWRADGHQGAWALRYTATSQQVSAPILHVNGVKTSVTVVVAGTVPPTGVWTAQQNANGQWFLVAPSTPSAGTLLQAWYNYQTPVIAQAQSTASQATYTGPNSGVFAEYINDTSATTVPMALARALRERNEYGFAAERYTFTTTEDFLGHVRAGQTCTIVNQFLRDFDSNTWGVNDTFIIVANTISFTGGGYRTAQITAIRV